MLGSAPCMQPWLSLRNCRPFIGFLEEIHRRIRSTLLFLQFRLEMRHDSFIFAMEKKLPTSQTRIQPCACQQKARSSEPRKKELGSSQHSDPRTQLRLTSDRAYLWPCIRRCLLLRAFRRIRAIARLNRRRVMNPRRVLNRRRVLNHMYFDNA